MIRPAVAAIASGGLAASRRYCTSCGGDGRALNLGEISGATGMTKSSAQRCAHTLERLGYLKRDLHLKRWVLSPRSLSVANAYLTG